MKKLILLTILLVFATITFARKTDTPDKFSLNGHLQDMQLLWIHDFSRSWLTMNSINNRLDFRWYPSKTFRTHIGMRNIMNYGQIVQLNHPGYHDVVVTDQGFFDMTFSLANDTSFFIYSTFDRANIVFTQGNFEARVGRQRINWGINQVWTPNDIFNTFNYFDFDYIERPGCDAIKLQYYTGMTSSAELAFKLGKNEEVTFAGIYRFNKWQYDFQFLGGVMNKDVVLGMGWSGQIEGAGFNGELSYFHAAENFSDSTGEVVASAGINYTFGNSLYIHFAGLFNSAGTTGPASMDNILVLSRDITAKNFTRARYSLFGQVSYPVTPLIKADLAGIFNPNDKSFYVGPSIDFSLTQNISFLIMGQLFFGDPRTEFGDYGRILFIRLKWTF